MYSQRILTEGRVSEGAFSYGFRPSNRNHQLSFDFGDHGRTQNGFRDPAFSENKTQPLHRWVPWIAGFSAQFVQDCFETFHKDRKRKPAPCVLDPFAGVGTTLVQALLNGFNSVGFEINPYAALACKIKLNSAKLDLEKLEASYLGYQEVAVGGSAPLGVLRPSEFAVMQGGHAGDVVDYVDLLRQKESVVLDAK